MEQMVKFDIARLQAAHDGGDCIEKAANAEKHPGDEEPGRREYIPQAVTPDKMASGIL